MNNQKCHTCQEYIEVVIKSLDKYFLNSNRDLLILKELMGGFYENKKNYG